MCYVLEDGNKKALFCIHVDDILIAHNSDELADGIVVALQNKWDITDLGEPTRLLGMHLKINHELGTISVHQQDYIESLLKRFNMVECKPADTPHQPGVHLTKTMCPDADRVDEMKTVPYAELVGSLNWLASTTRPDIATLVGTLCRFISNPGRDHWKAAQRVLKYLSGTTAFGLNYKRIQENDSQLRGFSDADWAGCPETRRSTTGFVFMMSAGCVSWKSKLQLSTALSSVEEEYMTLYSAGREAKWIRQFLFETGFRCSNPTTINEDNSGCVAISNHNRSDSRTKHIDLKYHYIRKLIRSKDITVQYTNTNKMVADVFTKPTNSRNFFWCRKQIYRHLFKGAC